MSALAMTRVVRPVRLLRPTGVSPTHVFAAYKPAGIPSLGVANLRSDTGQHVSSPQDVEDTLLNRICDATGYSDGAAALVATGGEPPLTSSANVPLLIFDPISSPAAASSPSTSSNVDHILQRGLVLAATDPGDFTFLTRAAMIGAIERTYSVVCHIPRCMRPGKLSLLERIETDKASLIRKMDDAEQRLREELGAYWGLIPSCVYRDPYVRGRPFVADTLAERFELTGFMCFADTLTNEQKFHRRLGALFVSSSASSTSKQAQSCQSRDLEDYFDSACFSASPSFFKTRRAPNGNEDPFAQLKMAGCPRLDAAQLRRLYAANDNLFWLPRKVTLRDRVAAVNMQVELVQANFTLGLAQFTVQTSCASEPVVRAAFAAVGLPVINDPVNNPRFQQRLAALGAFLVERGVRAAHSETLANTLKLALSTTTADSIFSGCTEGHRRTLALLAAGSGVACTHLRFPNPRDIACKARLLTVAEQLRSGAHDGTESTLGTFGAPCAVQCEPPEAFGRLLSAATGADVVAAAPELRQMRREEAPTPAQSRSELRTLFTATASSNSTPAEVIGVTFREDHVEKAERMQQQTRAVDRALEQKGTPQLHRPSRRSSGGVRCQFCGGRHHVSACPSLEGPESKGASAEK